MTEVYYNEYEPFAVKWLRNLSAAGRIAPGRVDDRSILELAPSDVAPATQWHAFCGIGGWPHALDLAGWPRDLPVWTGSCPCQPFSSAGRGAGTDDERHLWPVWFELIKECRPAVLFGEQVSSPGGLEWLDVVQADLQREGYTFGVSDLCSAGVKAPHLRQRLYFMAFANGERLERVRLHLRERRSQQDLPEAAGRGETGALVEPDHEQRERVEEVRRQARNRAELRGETGAVADSLRGGLRTRVGDVREGQPDAGRRGEDGALADSERLRSGERRLGRAHGRPEVELDRHGDAGVVGDSRGAGGGRDAGAVLGEEGEGERERFKPGGLADEPEPSSSAGFWDDAEWLYCTDGKYRPVEPGTSPLASRVPGRVGLIRGYGNAITVQVAAEWIRWAMEYLER